MTERDAFRGLLLCLVLSGISGLVYEVAWVRSLELIFGATSFAVATVLASFMGGLAAGSWLSGRHAGRLAPLHPLGVYAAIEGLIGLLALIIPSLFRSLVPVYQWAGRLAGDSFAAHSLFRFLLCVAVLLVPTALMGATLPIVSRFACSPAAGPAGEGARRVGLLYAINTSGAVLGCAAAGFLLLPVIGLLGTQRVAVAVNLAAAAGALVLAARAPRFRCGGDAWTGGEASVGSVTPTAGSRAPRVGPAAPAPGPAAPARVSLLIGAYALSGAVALLYEVGWSRFLVLVLGSTTYSYTIMLATFLLGLALGAGLGSRLLRASADPVLPVALCQLLVGVTTFLGLFVAGELPFLYQVLHHRLHPAPAGLLLIQLALSSAVMILPTLGLGAMFPLTIGGLGLTGDRAQPLVARAYAWNTAGAIAGSLLAGFLLVPAIGSRNTLMAGVAVNALIALAGLVAARSADLTRGRRTALVTLITAFLLNLLVATPAWRAEVMSSGMFRYADRFAGLDRAAFYDRLRRSHGDILFFEEGLTCSVTVFRTTQSLSLLVNGKPDASVPPDLVDPAGPGRPVPLGDLPTQVLAGNLPLLAAPRADDVLVIGLGSGVTLGSVLNHPVRRVDCLELEPAVVRASRFFDAHSGAPLRDPRVRLVVNDARNDLLVRDAAYDVIISEPSNPWIPGAAGLFTRDFFRIARARLRPEGIFCQWIQLYELWPEDFRAIMRGFLEAFPAAQVYRVGPDAIVLGAASHAPMPLARIRERAGDRVRADLARIGIRSPEELLAHLWIGGGALRGAVPPGLVNTDDNMLIEFAAPLRMLARDPERLEAQKSALAAMFSGSVTGLAPGLIDFGTEAGQESGFLARLAEAALARGYQDEAIAAAERSLALSRNPAAARIRFEALGAAGRREEAALARREAEREFPGDAPLLRSLLVADRREGDAAEERRHAEALLRIRPDDDLARLSLAESLDRSGDAVRALRVLEPLLPRRAAGGAGDAPPGPAAPDAPDGAALLLGRLLLRAGRPSEAVPPLREHAGQHPEDKEALLHLAEALRQSGALEEAALMERRAGPGAAAEAAALLERARSAFNAGRTEESIAILEEARQIAPADEAVAFLLARAQRRRGEGTRAIATVEAAIRLRPDHPALLGLLSQLLAEAGRGDRARAITERYRALTGSDWEPVAD
jgi:spermidine synthase